MRILNLYCGIGGNRKLWGDEHEVVAIENEPKIAKIYKDFFPTDEVIVTDAHEYLLNHYKEFDFIWSSPPCPSHSRVRKYSAVARGQNEAVFPDMKLYEEILFLQGYFKGKFCVENVIAWYEPLVKPIKLGRHFFWTNFDIEQKDFKGKNHLDKQSDLQRVKGMDISKYNIGIRKDKILRNCVEPEVGEYIFQQAYKIEAKTPATLGLEDLLVNPKGEEK